MQAVQQEFHQDLMREIRTLPENQLSDVLEYVRFLKFKALSGKQIEQRFILAVEQARKIAKKEKLTEDDIQNEIAQMKAGG